jgi:nitroreductase
MMNLPTPKTEGALSLEQAIKNRRTVRAFGAAAIDPNQLSQLLWAAQGITADRGALRAAPSAGALYPMDVYVVVGKKGVNGIEAGHIGQNVFLQAEALGLKAGIVGAFDDKAINRALNMPLSHEPLVVMPVGYRR